MSRHVHLVEPGVLRIDQRTRIGGTATGTDVSGPALVYAHARVSRGRVGYLSGDDRLAAPPCFEIWMPPFSMVQASLDGCDVVSTAFVSLPPGNVDLPATPWLVEAPPEPPATWRQVLARLSDAGRGVSVPRERDPSRIARQAKAILDGEYATPATIAQLAERLGVSPSALSRAFRKSYGLAPVRYRHQVRVMDAVVRFASGGAPVDVSLDVGFEDLSRFYKVFRQLACGVPGVYRPPRSRNAKTR